MSDMWFKHRLFPSNTWRQDKLLRLSYMLVGPEAYVQTRAEHIPEGHYCLIGTVEASKRCINC
jgi:hypothetical protein